MALLILSKCTRHRSVCCTTITRFLSARPEPAIQEQALPSQPFSQHIADTNVIGLVNPQFMNKMRTRFPVMWALAGTSSISSVLFALFLDHDLYALLVVPTLVFANFTALLMVGMMWYNARSIGKLSLNDGGTTVTLSHLTLTGRRVDKVVPVKDLGQMTRFNHRQQIGEELYFINWTDFKVNDQLWNAVLPTQKPRVLIPDRAKRG
eukprot:sb/3470367/